MSEILIKILQALSAEICLAIHYELKYVASCILGKWGHRFERNQYKIYSIK